MTSGLRWEYVMDFICKDNNVMFDMTDATCITIDKSVDKALLSICTHTITRTTTYLLRNA